MTAPLHHELEKRLSSFLEVQYLSLFCNGTVALLVTLEALRINSGDLSATPFSFPATAHVLYSNRVRSGILRHRSTDDESGPVKRKLSFWIPIEDCCALAIREFTSKRA
jgi:hypothetical protein